jgi:N-ethylmaleimide reductase
LLEVVQVLIEVFGPGRVGVKLTPVTHHADMNDSDPLNLY